MSATQTVFRVEVTTKGETGYLTSDVRLVDLHTHWAVTFDKRATGNHRTRERAERWARKVAGLFDRVEVVEEAI